MGQTEVTAEVQGAGGAQPSQELCPLCPLLKSFMPGSSPRGWWAAWQRMFWSPQFTLLFRQESSRATSIPGSQKFPRPSAEELAGPLKAPPESCPPPFPRSPSSPHPPPLLSFPLSHAPCWLSLITPHPLWLSGPPHSWPFLDLSFFCTPVSRLSSRYDCGLQYFSSQDTWISMVFSTDFFACDATSGFQEALPGFAAVLRETVCRNRSYVPPYQPAELP